MACERGGGGVLDGGGVDLSDGGVVLGSGGVRLFSDMEVDSLEANWQDGSCLSSPFTWVPATADTGISCRV